jgi:hypothetical protein
MSFLQLKICCWKQTYKRNHYISTDACICHNNMWWLLVVEFILNYVGIYQCVHTTDQTVKYLRLTNIRETETQKKMLLSLL